MSEEVVLILNANFQLVPPTMMHKEEISPKWAAMQGS